MTREEKNEVIEGLAVELANNPIFYLTDASGLEADATSLLRRRCFGKNVSLKIVKNSLLKKAMEKVEGKDYSPFYDTLVGNTALMFSEVGNAPALIIKEFRKKSEKPLLKGAFVEEAIFIGDDQLQTLCDIKSKEELLGDIIGLLQSPAKNVISALKSSGGTIAGIVKTLSEKE